MWSSGRIILARKLKHSEETCRSVTLFEQNRHTATALGLNQATTHSVRSCEVRSY